ncbi:TetR/AcrR family transcriptional regulator [Pseudomonas sp. NPDC079086]|jgi:TetR/AcrR family transcriptional regulator, mexJK operon transcriptional repressor|uniref:TetR/AcrR family transcriptional regulator n=1 Tax=unclassified Pseudomonas TaxID=196821 RepID=UPI001DB691DD|nr:TetR/AcrR family transcriptional regulator [Gammaproteobacteria bacterium]MBU2155759.1 TetR/AcrR family transcriptional regulator [Gammaproteobacteria bacterium]MBU2254145.1 TetR/AcrR family transcriptional regulator [Gammaproteobacteria bacterium]MBU2296579.1 TetR/AcrR family transcriptional regulator [Gammaproteobacteria bacterium]
MPNKVLPPSGPGRPKDLAKRKAILEAAKALFLSNGYDGSSMDAIAAEAGVSKLTVYSHFTDKEKLFAEAVKSKCEEQLPELLFELDDEVPVAQLLLNIGRGFNELINSRESVELHRVMVSLAAQDSKLSRMFYEAGPQRVLHGMEELLRQADQSGKLRVPDPLSAADQFFCLIKGGANFRLLIGCGEALQGAEAEAHVCDAVEVFLRAFRAD